MAGLMVPTTKQPTSSSLAGSTQAEWSASIPYTTGDEVKVSFESDGVTPRFPVYEYRAVGDSTGHYPPAANVSYWVKLGAQNAHAMFDLLTDQKTIGPAATTITITLPQSTRLSRLALLGLANVANIRIMVTAGATTLYDRTIETIERSGVTGYWSWLFGTDEYSYRRSVVADLPGGVDTQVTTTVTPIGSASAEIGWLLLGQNFDLGPADWDAEANPKDYSRFETDQFGITSFVPRRVVDDLRGTIWIDTKDYNRIYSLLRNNMNKLVFFDLNNTTDSDQAFDPIRAFGKLESVSGGLAYGKTPLNIKISGLS